MNAVNIANGVQEDYDEFLYEGEDEDNGDLRIQLRILIGLTFLFGAISAFRCAKLA